MIEKRDVAGAMKAIETSAVDPAAHKVLITRHYETAGGRIRRTEQGRIIGRTGTKKLTQL
jgi:hypothetical protein